MSKKRLIALYCKRGIEVSIDDTEFDVIQEYVSEQIKKLKASKINILRTFVESNKDFEQQIKTEVDNNDKLSAIIIEQDEQIKKLEVSKINILRTFVESNKDFEEQIKALEAKRLRVGLNLIDYKRYLHDAKQQIKKLEEVIKILDGFQAIFSQATKKDFGNVWNVYKRALKK